MSYEVSSHALTHIYGDKGFGGGDRRCSGHTSSYIDFENFNGNENDGTHHIPNIPKDILTENGTTVLQLAAGIKPLPGSGNTPQSSSSNTPKKLLRQTNGNSILVADPEVRLSDRGLSDEDQKLVKAVQNNLDKGKGDASDICEKNFSNIVDNSNFQIHQNYVLFNEYMLGINETRAEQIRTFVQRVNAYKCEDNVKFNLLAGGIAGAIDITQSLNKDIVEPFETKTVDQIIYQNEYSYAAAQNRQCTSMEGLYMLGAAKDLVTKSTGSCGEKLYHNDSYWWYSARTYLPNARKHIQRIVFEGIQKAQL